MTRSSLSVSEVNRRLPALSLIDNQQIRRETQRLTQNAPSYFWKRSGSTSGYHNAHQHGLWKHTLKLSTVLDRLVDSWVELGHISERDVDRVHAAAILHDQRKEGATGGQTARDHDLQMGEVIRDSSALENRVAAAVDAHMGPWYDGPEPRPGTLEDLLHVADMVASAPAIEVYLPEPVPNELQPYAVGGMRVD